MTNSMSVLIVIVPWQEMLHWRSFQDLPDEEMMVGGSRKDLLAQQERKCSVEERKKREEEEARRSSLEEKRKQHLRKEVERRISLEAEVSLLTF